MNINKIHSLIYSRNFRWLLFIFLILVFILPSVVFGAETKGVVPDCNTAVDDKGKFTNPCGFDQLVALGNSIISFLIKIGASLGAVSFAYAGWLYVTSGGDSGAVSKAKDIFWKVVLGFIFMLSAWLLIKLILVSLGYSNPTGIGFIDALMRK